MVKIVLIVKKVNYNMKKNWSINGDLSPVYGQEKTSLP